MSEIKTLYKSQEILGETHYFRHERRFRACTLASPKDCDRPIGLAVISAGEDEGVIHTLTRGDACHLANALFKADKVWGEALNQTHHRVEHDYKRSVYRVFRWDNFLLCWVNIDTVGSAAIAREVVKDDGGDASSIGGLDCPAFPPVQ